MLFRSPLQEILDQTGQPFRESQGKTYYKDATSFRSATPIHVAPGQDISGLTLSTRTMEARHITGQVTQEILTTYPHVFYLLEEGSGSPGIWRSVRIQDDGRFRVDGLFPDYYLVQSAGVVSKEVDLTNGDADDLTLEPDGPIELAIKIHIEGGKPQLPVRGLALRARKPTSWQSSEPITTELIAENTFQAVARLGEYEFQLDGDGAPYFIKSLKVDGEAQAQPVLFLNGRRKRLIDLVLSSDAATIEGRVSGDPGTISGSTILVEDESDPGSTPQKVSSENGQFRCTVLTAGRYRLYAFEDFDEEAWGNPELAALLAAQSAVVEVKEGEHLQLKLPLIRDEEFLEALEKSDSDR